MELIVVYGVAVVEVSLSMLFVPTIWPLYGYCDEYDMHS